MLLFTLIVTLKIPMNIITIIMHVVSNHVLRLTITPVTSTMITIILDLKSHPVIPITEVNTNKIMAIPIMQGRLPTLIQKLIRMKR